MKVRRVRCPKCKSLRTVKNGKREVLDYSLQRKSRKEIQRYKCKECGNSFTIRKNPRQRYTRDFMLELTRMHVEERMSYRVIAKRIKERYAIRISKNTACRLVNQVALYSKGDIRIKEEYHPHWQGYLTVDDKYYSVCGEKKMILTATDSSGELLHIEMLEQIEQHRADEFFGFIKDRLDYQFKGISTDMDEMLEKSIEKRGGKDVPHQKCLKYAMDAIDRIFELKQKRRKLQCTVLSQEKEYRMALLRYREAEKIYNSSKQVLYGKEPVAYLYKELKRIEKKYPGLKSFFNRHLDKLLTYKTVPEINKTNNIAENMNRQLMRRLKTIESFKSPDCAKNYLNLYKNYLRFKPYTDCRGNNKIKNGKSPIEVCGVKLKTKDWLKNAVSFY